MKILQECVHTYVLDRVLDMQRVVNVSCAYGVGVCVVLSNTTSTAS